MKINVIISNGIRLRTIGALIFIMMILNCAYSQSLSKVPKVISPEILQDNSVIFRLYAPEANNITISGEWMIGNTTNEKLIKSEDGIWTIKTAPLKSELYVYSFNVDGIRALDPNNVQASRSGKTYSNYLILPGDKSSLYEYKDVPHGTLSKRWYDARVMKMNKRVFVYTPPGYESSKENYPVLYLLHGGLEDEESWVNKGRSVQILDNLIAQGLAKPMIVVMPNGNGNEKASQNDMKPLDVEQSRESVFADAVLFSKSLVEDIIPFIESNFRTYNDKDHRAIAGLSLGAINTQTITNNNPNIFSYIGVFSYGILNLGKDTEEIAKNNKERDLKIEALKNSRYKLYWIGCGKDDFVYPTVVELKKILDSHSFSYVYRESTGGHTHSNWRLYLSEFAPLLFK